MTDMWHRKGRYQVSPLTAQRDTVPMPRRMCPFPHPVTPCALTQPQPQPQAPLKIPPHLPLNRTG